MDYSLILGELKKRDNFRELETSPIDSLNFSTNDYLALSTNQNVKNAAIKAIELYGTGSLGSRLMCGNNELVSELEERLASFLGYESALVYGSGFLANIGLLETILDSDDIVLFDKLNHASLIDGVLRSKAKWKSYKHNDMDDLRKKLKRIEGVKGRIFIVVESVFSMDGDVAEIQDIGSIAREFGAFTVVDEAHAFGVFGECGKGVCATLGVKPDILSATFSKAYANYGGFVACSEQIKSFLINRSKPFIYSTALPPSVVGGILGAFGEISEKKELGNELLKRSRYFYDKLQNAGFDLLPFESQIIPVIVGDNARALLFAGELKRHGVYAKAIRPPTVPVNSSRIRLSLTLGFTQKELDESALIMERCGKDIGLL